jgi:hypothetical protein
MTSRQELAKKLYEGIRDIIPDMPQWEDLSDDLKLQIEKDLEASIRKIGTKNKKRSPNQ